MIQQRWKLNYIKLKQGNNLFKIRVDTLEQEITNNTKKFAQEIARLKMHISEKESIIETLRMENLI